MPGMLNNRDDFYHTHVLWMVGVSDLGGHSEARHDLLSVPDAARVQ
jgi:hypothetical protein